MLFSAPNRNPQNLPKQQIPTFYFLQVNLSHKLIDNLLFLNVNSGEKMYLITLYSVSVWCNVNVMTTAIWQFVMFVHLF